MIETATVTYDEISEEEFAVMQAALKKHRREKTCKDYYTKLLSLIKEMKKEGMDFCFLGGRYVSVFSNVEEIKLVGNSICFD